MYLYLTFCIFVLFIVVLLYCCKSALREIAAISRLASHPQSLTLLDTSQAHQCQWVLKSLQRGNFLFILRIKTLLECSQPACQLAHFWCSQPSCANMLCFHAIQYICSFSTIYIATQGKTKHNTIYNFASPAVLISPPQRWDNIWDPHCEQSRQSRKW